MDTARLQELIDSFLPKLADFGISALLALAIFVIGRWIANMIAKGLRKGLSRGSTDPTLIGFVVSLVRVGLLAFVVIAALSQLGIETASFIAVIGAAGLAVGLALQGSLANFASGVLLLVFRPIKVGDFVEAGGTAGSVREIGIFTTVLNTPDNKRVIVPNAQVTGGIITNYSANDTRRVDLVASIGYGDDVAKAKAVLERIVHGHELVLPDPAPQIEVSTLGESSVDIVVRPWVQTADYWRVYFDLTEAIKREFDREGISIPFPQRDVHLFQAKAN